jgi:opacity protein-like surface antigen
MWTKTKIALASVMLLGVAGAANAADLIVDDVPVADIPVAGDWTGAYVGGHIGWVSGNVDWELIPQPGPADSYGLSGWLLGAQGGYNWQMDTFVLGLEGDVSLGDVLSDEDLSGFIDRQINWEASLRARAGVAFDAVLLYATAGVAVANSTSEIFSILDDTQTHIGWTVGIGAEAMVAENVSAKLEYRYSDFGSATYDYFTLIPPGLSTESTITQHSLTAGVNFHF